MRLDLEFCERNVLQLLCSQALSGIHRRSVNRFYGGTPATAMSEVLHFARSVRMVAYHML